MLAGTRGAQDFQQRTYEAIAGNGGVRELLRDMRGDFRQAPAIRRARL
jgi:hypothetical protein